MVIMCLDYGKRYIGVAVSDGDGKIALRHSTIDQREDDDFIATIASEIYKRNIMTVLVGVPMGLSGTQTDQTQISWQFMAKLGNHLGEDVKIVGVDESFTSKEAARIIRAEGGNIEDEHMEAARLMLAQHIKSR